MNSIAHTSLDVAGEIQALALEFMHEGLSPILAYTRAAGQVDGLLTWAGERELCGSVWRVADVDERVERGLAFLALLAEEERERTKVWVGDDGEEVGL